jgi:hypothetical protein
LLLKGLLKEVDSAYFPITQKEAVVALSAGPLKRARMSLIRSFCTVLLKDLIFGTVDFKRQSRLIAAIQTVMTIHREEFLSIVKDQFPRIVADVSDEQLYKVAYLICSIPECMDALADNLRIKIIRYVENIPPDEFNSLEFYHGSARLVEAAEHRMRRATREDFDNSVFFAMPSVLSDRLIRLYTTSRNFAAANWAASTIVKNISDISMKQKIHVVATLKSNDQILYSSTLPALINKLRESADMPGEEFDKVLVANGLEKYTKKSVKDDDDIPF